MDGSTWLLPYRDSLLWGCRTDLELDWLNPACTRLAQSLPKCLPSTVVIAHLLAGS
jgi:hypothetical protein